MRRLTPGFVALALFGAAAITGSPATLLNASAAAPAPILFQNVSLDQAQVVLEAAVAAAEEQGTLMDIAVVDAGGTLKAFASMDGAWPGSIDIAVSKARTARFFEVPTEILGELSQPGGPLYGIETTNDGLVTFPGGLPLIGTDGTVIGGIGVSGSTVENDRAVAEAGAAALIDTGASLDTTVAGVAASKPQVDILDLKSGGGGKAGGVVGSKNRNAGEEIPSQQDV